MPCCVTGCPGSVRLVQFPSDSVLRRRWRDVITLAAGTGPTVEEHSLELCEDHFERDSSPAERYREPTRFSDRSGHPVELGSCRLCHRFEVASRLYSLDGPMADVAIGTVLRESFKVQLGDDDFLRFICGVCLTQVGMVLTIQKSFLIKGDPGVENRDRTDPLAEVTCCRLCHRYEPTNTMCFLDDDLTDGVTIGSTLNAILQSEDDLAQLICLNCLAKIDLMRSVQSFFVGKDEEFRGWQREGLVTVDLDCHPELLLEVKVEPVEIQETARKGRKRKAKEKEPKMVKEKPKIECKICNKKFAKNHSLNFHMLIHTGELPHKCSHCDASFRMSTELSKHVMGVHEGKTAYDCKECNVPLATKTEYYRHRKTAHATGYKRVAVLYRCLVCEKSCKSVGEIRNHIEALHAENYPYLECPECPKSQLTCAAHVKVHGYYKHPDNGTVERFPCDTCGKDFDKKTLLQKHVRAVHSEPGTSKEYACSQCDKTFRLYSTYHRHKGTHTGIKRYACTICEQTFSQPTSLKYHMRNVHTLEKPFRCEDCGDSFRLSSAFNKHRDKYHSPNAVVEDKVACPTCLEEFLTKSLLQQHVRSVHEERKEFACLECGKVYKNFANLNRHRDSHNETRKHPCSFCDKSFTQQISLNNHIRNRHTGEEPFMCADCGETFRDSSVFYKHRANQHPNQQAGQTFPCETCGEQFAQKPLLLKHRRSAHLSQLVCPECGKLFSSSSTLNRHLETHSDTRKYGCSFCELSFTQQTSLKNHVRNRHTGETPFGCDKCGEAFRDSSKFYKHRAKCRVESVEVAVKTEPENPLGDDPCP
ncbi:zinc finger protein 595 [Culex quinquefasciatus]|uniref:zinc finger protein 595 n=1 Tax=Culex quinquefasciatus TaxID=7176 RepID=UPI0018E351F0|nr:zinc finger protein 595 [Culex quinquefasciatus]